MNIWLIADIAVVVLIGVLVYFSMKKGFLKSSYSGLSNFVALILVFTLNAPFGDYIEHSQIGDIVREKVYTSVELAISKQDGNQEDTKKDEPEIMGFMSGWVEDIIEENNNQIKKNLTETAAGIIYPIVMQILSIIFLYLLLRILMWIAFRVCKLFFEIPVLGIIDKGLGAVIGGANALLIIYIISAVLFFVLPAEAQAFENGINSTYIFKFFYYNNLIINIFF